MPVSWAEPWDRVRRRCPVASMTRATHQYPFTDSFLDDLSLVGALAGVVFSAYPTFRFLQQREQLRNGSSP